MAPPTSPSILLLHDGELEDARALLESLGASPSVSRAQDPSEPVVERGWDLIVTTARRALAHPECLRGGETSLPPVRVVVATEDSPTLRRQLRAAGFDYLVRRPVDPGALRLLFLRLLYQGPERRARERHPSGREVTYRLGRRQHRAVLGDLSESGCRLLRAEPARPGERISVDTPVDEGGRATLAVDGTVLRAALATGDETGATLAVAFDALAESAAARIREALRTRVLGGVQAPHPESTDRRRGPRGAFRKRVVALRAEADRVLMGCDLSLGGMRVDWHPHLSVGDRLRLAIYAEAGTGPWIVSASVVRNDPHEGLALRFEDLSAGTAKRLEAFVASLPPVEPLQRGELGSLGAVLTQILE